MARSLLTLTSFKRCSLTPATITPFRRPTLVMDRNGSLTPTPPTHLRGSSAIGAYLRLSPPFVRALCRGGKLSGAYREGRRWCLDPDLRRAELAALGKLRVLAAVSAYSTPAGTVRAYRGVSGHSGRGRGVRTGLATGGGFPGCKKTKGKGEGKCQPVDNKEEKGGKVVNDGGGVVNGD